MSAATLERLAWEDVPVGRVDGKQHGYQRDLLATVSVRLEPVDREVETVTHAKVTDVMRLSVVSAVWNPRRSDIVLSTPGTAPLGHIKRLEPGWETGHIMLLAELAEFHLNDMTAACIHQEPVYVDGRLEVEPCEFMGYRYGSAWLYRPLPDGTDAALRCVFGGGRA